MKNNILYLSILVLLLLPLVSSAPPFQASIGTGLQLESPKYSYLQQNTTFKFHIHVINSTAIKTNTTTSCILHLYNQTGSHILENNLNFDKNNLDFDITINPNNFSSLGHYSYISSCNSTNEIGFVSDSFEVTPMGLAPSGDNQIIFYSILFIILSASLVFLFLHSLGHFVKLDTDLIDVAYSWGAYFALLAYYALESYYLGNPRIDNITLLAIKVGAFTAFAMPFIAFMVSMLTQTLMNRKIKEERGYI